MILLWHQIPLLFRNNLFERIYKLIQTNDDKIRDEKPQYDINREAIKVSAFYSGKIDKYECLTGEGILSCNQSTTIDKGKFTYFSVGKAFEKQIKTIENYAEKQIKAI